jgi:hypothetical protein
MGLPAGIWARLEIRDCGYETPCLAWTGTIDSNGYGVISIKGCQHYVHRLVYEAVSGPMPKKDENGKRIVSDHLCRNRACAAPGHVDPVTDKTNVMRGISFAPANAAKTRCDNGHEFTTENTIVDKKGRRACLECRRAGDRKRYAERRARENAERVGRPRRVAALKPETKPVKLAPCGTLSAHTRHVRRKEPIDQACRDVHAAHMREWKRAKKKAAEGE